MTGKYPKHKSYWDFYLSILMNVFLWYFAKLGSEIKWMLVSTPWQQCVRSE